MNPSRPSRGVLISALPVLLAAGAAVAVYANSLAGGFIYDDIDLIVNNPWLTSADGIFAAFSTNVRGFYPDLPVTNYYRPLIHIFNMLIHHLAGPSPFAFHLANVALHAAVCILLTLIVARMMSEVGTGDQRLRRDVPLITGLFFALHPVHAESVAWIAGSPDLLLAFFGSLSFLLYLRLPSPATPGRNISFSSVAAFFLATLSKEAAIVLPVLFVAYDIIVRRLSWQSLTRLAGRLAPYLVALGFSLMLRVLALGSLAPEGSGIAGSLSVQTAGMFQALGWDLWRVVIPNGYTVCSELMVDDRPLRHPLTLAALLSVLGWALGWRAVSRRHPLVQWAGLAFLLPLLPVLASVTSLKMPMADRYLYVPSMGFCLAAAYVLCVKRPRTRHAAVSRGIILAVLAFLLGTVTAHRNLLFKDERTFWSHSVRRLPHLPWPRDLRVGAPEAKPLPVGILDKAVSQRLFGYSAANNYFRAAVLLAGEDRTGEAAAYLELLASLAPGDVRANALGGKSP